MMQQVNRKAPHPAFEYIHIENISAYAPHQPPEGIGRVIEKLAAERRRGQRQMVRRPSVAQQQIFIPGILALQSLHKVPDIGFHSADPAWYETYGIDPYHHSTAFT
jgi:hypothetical protein